MPLQQTSWTLADKTGAVESINLDASNTTIVGVSYGTDASGNPVNVPTDGKSFQITVLAGTNPLIVTLFSPGPDSDTVYVQQRSGNTVTDLDSFVVYRQEVWAPLIQGT